MLTITLICVFLSVLVEGQAYCRSNDTQPYNLFATKTSYFEVDNEDMEPVTLPGCEAKSFWLLVRHGTRNPGDDSILEMNQRGPILRDQIVENHEAELGSLCDSDLSALRSWSPSLSVEDESELTPSGALEMNKLGQRFRARFPGLLDQPADRDKYHFRHTIKVRTGDSARAYAEGAFPGEEVFMPEPLEEDPMLRFYDFCTKWKDEVDDNDETYREQDLFEESQEMTQLLQRVNQRLGFGGDEKANSEIPLADVFAMYDLCRYEKAFNPEQVSPWCSAFQQEDLIVLEYHQDLKYYYKNGYANELNYQMACPLIKDLAAVFNSNASSLPLGTFYFSHSEALLPFLALLDLYHDDVQPTHDNFQSTMERQYRTSRIGSFSTGVGFALFGCEDGTEKVMAFHQEGRVRLAQCDQDPCDWNQFQEKYQSAISCPFNDLCEVQENNKRQRERKKEEKNGASQKQGTIIIVCTHFLIYFFYFSGY